MKNIVLRRHAGRISAVGLRILLITILFIMTLFIGCEYSTAGAPITNAWFGTTLNPYEGMTSYNFVTWNGTAWERLSPGGVGPAGPTGPAGADGADGATGATGATGPAGDNATTNYKLKSFTYDLSTASGSQNISGIGFQPRALIAYGGAPSKGTCHGMSDSNRNGMCQYGAVSVYPAQYDTTHFMYLVQNPGVDWVYCTVSTYWSDGFILSWVKNGTPTGTITIIVMCFQ